MSFLGFLPQCCASHLKKTHRFTKSNQNGENGGMGTAYSSHRRTPPKHQHKRTPIIPSVPFRFVDWESESDPVELVGRCTLTAYGATTQARYPASSPMSVGRYGEKRHSAKFPPRRRRCRILSHTRVVDVARPRFFSCRTQAKGAA